MCGLREGRGREYRGGGLACEGEESRTRSDRDIGQVFTAALLSRQSACVPLG